MGDLTGTLPAGQLKLLPFLESSAADSVDVQLARRALYEASGFWAALEQHALATLLATGATERLRFLGIVYSAIGAESVARELKVAFGVLSRTCTPLQHAECVAALEARLAGVADPLDGLVARFARQVAEGTPAHAVVHTALAGVMLRASESRYRRLFETAQDGILLLNADSGQIEDVNPYLIRMLGYTHQEFLGRKLWEIGAFADWDECRQAFAKLQAEGYIRYEDLPLRAKSGKRLEVEFVSNAYEVEGIRVIQCNIRDITARRAAEVALRRQLRLFAALSECNRAIVHSRGQDELFESVCRAAVQTGAMKMAWVGLADPVTGLVRPVASHGDTTGYLPPMDATLPADAVHGQGPTTRVMRTGQAAWHQDFLNDFATAPWHEPAARAGFVASGALPLLCGGRRIGTFSVYSGELQAFDSAVRDLLAEIAADVSFALDNFVREARRAAAEAQVSLYLEKLRIAVMGTVEVAMTISELRDPYTAGHERKVGQLAVAIAAAMGLDEECQAGLRVSGYLHDIGKIAIPGEILAKPTALNSIEMQLIRQHPQASHDILRHVDWPWPVAQIVLQHHERMDGSGYPQGLAGDAILPEARILAVADVVDAMSSHRPYRAALGIEAALAEIARGRGTLYDVGVADACARAFRAPGAPAQA